MKLLNPFCCPGSSPCCGDIGCCSCAEAYKVFGINIAKMTDNNTPAFKNVISISFITRHMDNLT